MGVRQVIKKLDAFPRAEDHLLHKTKSGALVSIIGLIIMATLFLHELGYYLTTYTVHQMSVDLKRGETLPIHINMTFPYLPCDGSEAGFLCLTCRYWINIKCLMMLEQEGGDLKEAFLPHP
ncbi:hypothetical protein K1719_033412 [Acacia pycnantha]|nr:hypothetical protein K1719_033412 [Acacia pycnantha]